MLFLQIIIFIVSLFILVKGADWLLVSSEKIGLKIGMSPFIIGVTIVAFGTSLPELVSSFFAVFQGLTEFPVANVIGSNIANILLVIGISTILAKRLAVTKDLIDLDLPLVAITTGIFLIIVWDGTVNFYEALFLIVTYVVYLGFSLIYKDDESGQTPKRPNIKTIDIMMLVIGILGLSFGAKFLISSVVELSVLLNIAPGIITITAVAIGTSLPEVIVSAKAALRRNSEVALGNVFGSNIFNILIVVGVPGIFRDLTVDEKTLTIGVPVLILSTGLFIVSGISKRVHVQEGVLFLLLYVIFIAKLFGLF